MELTVKTTLPPATRSDCLVVGVFERRKLSAAAQELDAALDGRLAALLKRGDLDGKEGNHLLLPEAGALPARRLLLVGCGKEKDFDTRRYRKALRTAVSALKKIHVREAVNYLPDLPVRDRSLPWRIRIAAETLQQADYRFDTLKSEKDRPPALKKMTLNVIDKAHLNKARQALAIGNAIAGGANFARELGNLPGNVCTPAYLAGTARKTLKAFPNMNVRVLRQKDIEALKMGAFLSVARGSRQPPHLIVVEYRGADRDSRPVALVGKGITFDSGGISIKPSAAMDEMKFDMCGAAGVLGTMHMLGELQPPINVVAVVPTCENMPDGNANKPGDIVTSLSGQTIEVLNTDAEGRLILCDALTYTERFKPKAVIDVATLTGACVIALGKHPAGLLGNDEALIRQILDAGEKADDRAWQLPLWEEYQDQLKSNFADMANIGGREAGAITAACFLARFTKKLKWAHLDIAGVAWESGSKKGATGRPVALLSQYLLEQCGKRYRLE